MPRLLAQSVRQENIKTATLHPLISLSFSLYNVLTRPPIESRCDFSVFVQVLEASLRAPVALD
jgi:hypothetical protein